MEGGSARTPRPSHVHLSTWGVGTSGRYSCEPRKGAWHTTRNVIKVVPFESESLECTERVPVCLKPRLCLEDSGSDPETGDLVLGRGVGVSHPRPATSDTPRNGVGPFDTGVVVTALFMSDLGPDLGSRGNPTLTNTKQNKREMTKSPESLDHLNCRCQGIWSP